MQHQGHVQMINRICNHGQIRRLRDAPRWHVYEDFSVGVKHDSAVVEDLRARGHQVRVDARQHQAADSALGDGYVAFDHRKEGPVAGIGCRSLHKSLTKTNLIKFFLAG